MLNRKCLYILAVLFDSLFSYIALPDPWMDSVKISDSDSRITYIPSPSEPADCSSPSKEEDPICACRWRSMYDAAANISLHTTCGPDTALELSFVGSELQLWGSTSSQGALAYVTIDNDTSTAATVNFTSTDGQTHNNVLLLDIAGLDLDPSRDYRLRLQYDTAASYGKQTKDRRYIFVDWFVVTQMTEDKGSSKDFPDSTGGSTIQPPAPPPPPHTTSSSTRSMSEVLFSGTQDSHTDVEVSSVLVVSGTTLTVTATVDVIAISSASASHSSDGRASRSFSRTRYDISSSSSATDGDSDSASSNSDSNLPDWKTMTIVISLSIVAFAVISLLLVLFLRRRAPRLRAKSTDSSMRASTGTRFDTTIRPFTIALSPSSPPEPQRSKTSTRDTLQVPGQDAAGHDEPEPPRPSMDSARTRVAVLV